MLEEDEIISYGYVLEENIYKASEEIFAEMIRSYSTLKDVKPEDITMLLKLGYKDFEIERILTESLNLTLKQYGELLEKIGEAEYEQYRYIYEWAGIKLEPYKNNPIARQIVNAIFEQTRNEMKNFTQTTGIIKSNGNFINLTDYFRERMNQAVLEITTGNFDYVKSMKATIVELKNSGIRIVDYESGWHNRIEVAVRRAVMTGLNQLTEDITNDTADRLGTEYFQVSAHNGARPSHAVWQGKVYTKSELVTKCGLGTGGGLKGWNCYHTYYPFIPGVSKNPYTDEQLRKWRYPTKTAWRGQYYTEYEARQKMRQMETKMRAQRLKIYLSKQAGMGADDLKADRIKYRQQLKQYKTFAKYFGLHTQLERVSGLDGLGRLA